jgi:hypothetical protein
VPKSRRPYIDVIVVRGRYVVSAVVVIVLVVVVVVTADVVSGAGGGGVIAVSGAGGGVVTVVAVSVRVMTSPPEALDSFRIGMRRIEVTSPPLVRA